MPRAYMYLATGKIRVHRMISAKYGSSASLNFDEIKKKY